MRNALVFGSIPVTGRVVFAGRGPMYLDRAETRGQRVWAQAGVTHLRMTFAWNAALRVVEPDLVLDVGANYGEIAFAGRYPPETDVVVVEANPDLAPYLRKSIAQRKSRAGGRWHLLEAAASDREGAASFFIDAMSSGTSRLSDPPGVLDKGRQQPVKLVRLDRLPIVKGKQRVVFKLDVEGAEVEALRGLAELLRQTQSFIGIVEMRGANLEALGTSAAELWNLARSLGRVAVFDHRDQVIDCTAWDYEDLVEKAGPLGLRVKEGADLVVYRAPTKLDSLSVPLWIKHCESIGKAFIPTVKSFRS